MNQQQAEQIAATYFPHYPDQQQLHVTSDEQVFFGADTAGNHAKTLEDKEVFVVEREAEVEEEAEVEAEQEPEAEAEKPKGKKK